MNPQGVQPVSGWQGMGQQSDLSLAPQQGSVPAVPQFQVDQNTPPPIKGGGSPNTSELASLAMLAMMA